MLDNSVPIDYEWYIDNLKGIRSCTRLSSSFTRSLQSNIRRRAGPVSRIFEPIMANVDALFTGDHTKKVSRPTPKSGGIVGFAMR